MEGYGYAIRSVSTYNVVRKEAQGTVKFPFVSASSNSEGYVTGKKPVQITGRPYDDDDDHDDYKKHGFPTEAYPMKADDERHRQESPVPGSPPKINQFLAQVQNEASRPQRSGLLAKPDLHLSARPNPYNNANGYADYGSDKEGRSLFGGTNRNSSYDYPDGYGGDYHNKEGYKASHSSIGNEKYNGYDGADYGYGGHGSRPVRNDKYDGANKGYGGDGNPNNKEGYKPTSSKYYGYNGANKGYGGYGNYNDKEGYKPTSDPPRNGNSGTLGGAMDPNRIIPGGTAGTAAAPMKRIQLSGATNDIEKVTGLMKEAAISDHSNNGGRKPTDTALPYNDSDNYLLKHDGLDRSAPRNNWAASLGNDSRLGEPRGKFNNGMDPVKEVERQKVVASPAQSQFSVPKPGMPNKNDFDQRNATSGHTNYPPRPITHVIDGRVANYNNNIDRRPIIDSKVAEVRRH